jgi:flavin-dependent dehydrogenase
MKIAIIGAGICGLYLAWKLAEKGEEVIVFEKKEKIGKEACSGLFSERILDFIPSFQKLIQNKIDFCLIHFPKKTLKIQFSKPFFVMDHAKLDRLVADLAEKSGAKIILNHSVNSLPEGFDRIIGCDGAMSQVRKILGLKDPQFRLGIQGFVREKNSSDYVETWPTYNGFTLRPFSEKGAGFIWKIPRGLETEYGIIEKPKKARIIFEEFLRGNNLSPSPAKRDEVGDETKSQRPLERINSALVPQGLIIPSNSSITLCGDASGLTKPWSGGGVIWGLLAADLLLKDFPDFLKYKNRMKKFFLPKIIFSKIATKKVYFLGSKIPWLLPKVVKIEGDFLV